MMINKACKSSIVHPSKDYINRIANYLPYRTKCLENLKQQLFPDEKPVHGHKVITSFVSTNTNDAKSSANVSANMASIESAGLLNIAESNRGLVNPFASKTATPDQQHDLLSFRIIGSQEFEKYILYYILRQTSVSAPQRKKRLATFAEKKPSKSRISQLEKDRRLIQKCLHKRMRWSKQTGRAVETLAEQYIELPLAIANNDGFPVKGQKSYATKALCRRYLEARPPVILNCLPSGWNPECSILEGMCMINTYPLGSHKTFADYAHFLIQRFVLPQFSRGSTEVHVIFDNPGRLTQTPKHFERVRRDAMTTISPNHTCDELTATTHIPPKWRETVINCRVCKRHLVCFLTQYMLQSISKHIPTGKKFVVAGGFEGVIQDTAWYVTCTGRPEPMPAYSSNAEETDTRLWLHVRASQATRILVMSPDTDVYHIGLPIVQKDVIVQINTYNSKEVKYLHLPNLKHALKSDPDLSAIPSEFIPQIFQTLFVTTGCDYISFFNGMGKATFLRYFYQFAEFITSGRGNTPGTLAHISLDDGQLDTGFLSFLRLIGTVYFKRHNTGFSTPNPTTHFNGFSHHSLTPLDLEHHRNWLEDIRQTIWDRVQFETEMIPSTDALYRHWQRSCWVLHLWRQADYQHITIKPLTEYGWQVDGDVLTCEWDSDVNVAAIRQRVQQLLKGCRCRTGCQTARCGCRKNNNTCGEGCECTDCRNMERNLPDVDSLMEVSAEEALMDSQDQHLVQDVEEFMDYVFGDFDTLSSDAEDTESLS